MEVWRWWCICIIILSSTYLDWSGLDNKGTSRPAQQYTEKMTEETENFTRKEPENIKQPVGLDTPMTRLCHFDKVLLQCYIDDTI